MWTAIAIGLLLGMACVAWYPAAVLSLMRLRLRQACKLHESTLTVDGMRWSYLIGGQGPTLVLLPGLGGNKYQWGLPFLRLAAHHRVIALDLPGGGGTSGRMDLDCTPERLASHVGRVLDRLGVQSFTLIGASIGGYVAGHLAAQCGSRVETLVLMNPAGLTAEEHTPVVASFLTSGRHPFSYTSVAEMDALYEVLFNKPPAMPMPLKRYLARRNERYVEDREMLLHGLRRAGLGGLSAALSGFHGRVLLIWGRDDKLLHGASVSALVKAAPHSHVVEVRDCGHLPYMERPDVCIREVTRFLNAA